MYNVTIFLLLGSAVAQICAAALAAMQMRRARGYRLAWGAISLAAILFVQQRLGPLELALNTGIYDFLNALTGALISLTMLFGMLGLRHVFRDLEKQRSALEKLAITDALTGLHNRRYTFERGVEEVLRSRRSGEPMALIMVDLDYFKRVNDAHGHAAGDAVLVAVADALRADLRQIDVLGRIGGEEFLLILPNTDNTGAGVIAERLRARIAQLGVVLQDGEKITQTASFGVISGLGSAHQAAENFQELLGQADTAMYVAKQRGRNCVAFWSPEMVIQAS
ncbi:MAG TPA: GGDEF domain-containing protein [Rhodocyclaceae bacterium]|nr:GGDEF domain-containing protein [Rhodocyclaceae bacterium]